MTAHLLFESDFDRREGVGPDLTLHHFDDGRRPRFEHICKRWADDREPDGEFVKVVAPSLHPDHVVTLSDKGTTVRASILCPDCGLHGFITDGKWA